VLRNLCILKAEWFSDSDICHACEYRHLLTIGN